MYRSHSEKSSRHYRTTLTHRGKQPIAGDVGNHMMAREHLEILEDASEIARDWIINSATY